MIDLRTDSGPPPTPEMHSAVQNGSQEDGTTDGEASIEAVEQTVADMVGKAAGLFVPTGTMANQVAVRAHTEPGQEVIVERQSHIYNREQGGLAEISHVQPRPVDGGEGGIPTPEQIHDAYFSEKVYQAETGLLALENTHNQRGGIAISPERIEAAAKAANELDVPVHLDGARIVHASDYHDCAVERFTEPMDSVYVDLAKLGAPAGAVLMGSASFVEQCRRERQLLGGHMAKTSFIGAPAMVALSDLSHIRTQHELAERLADGLTGYEGLSVQEPQTNIVFVDPHELGWTATDFLEACASEGVLGKAFGNRAARFCVGRNVDRAMVDEAIDRIRRIGD
ncbi:MAG: threonine aldolase family protein [Halodesulfurarchaeum sp.]